MKTAGVGLALLLAGCAGLPGARGFPEKVVHSGPDTITIEWNRWQLSDAAVRARAVTHCNGRRVEEVASDRHGMLRRSRTWNCVGQ